MKEQGNTGDVLHANENLFSFFFETVIRVHRFPLRSYLYLWSSHSPPSMRFITDARAPQNTVLRY